MTDVVVDACLEAVVAIKWKNLAEAVEQFIAADEPKTTASDGQWAQSSNAGFAAANSDSPVRRPK